MLSNLGDICLSIGIIFGILTIIYPFFYKRDFFYKIIFLSANCAVIFSFFILLYLFISNDFRVISVLMNTSSLMELKYRIAAAWSSHETSLLFWCFITSILNMIFFLQTDLTEKITYSISMFIQTCFVSCIFLTANPFNAITTKPSEGLGMNPSLQDVGIMIHPPMLYIAYGIFQIIYSMNIASLFTKNTHIVIANWSRMGLAILLAGIGLGSWWAYRELGWGGYWFFDPVENISLIIFLFALCYHHSLLQKNLDLTKVIFGTLPFLSALIGTFCVRSGLLVSVHSFAETSSSAILLGFGTFMAISSSIMIFLHFYKNPLVAQYSPKIYMIQAGNIIWSLSGLILIISIVAPIIFSIFFGNIVDIKESFFIKTVIPLTLLSSTLSGLIYFNRNVNKLIIICLCNLVAFVVVFVIFKTSLLQSFAYFSGSLIISSSIIRYFEKVKSRSLNISSISMLLAHASVGILIVAICYNKQHGFAKIITLDLHKNTKISEVLSASLVTIEYSNGPNYINQTAIVRILEGENEQAIINPQLRFYPVEKTLSSEIDIYSSLFRDWYGVLNNITAEKASLRIFYHPAISIIWFSLILCVFAIILRVRN